MPSSGVGLMSDKQLGRFRPRRGVSETPWSGLGAQLPTRACRFAPDCEMCSWGRGFPGEVGVLSAPPRLPSGNVPPQHRDLAQDRPRHQDVWGGALGVMAGG